MIGRHPSENVRVVAALMVPFVLVFGVYVVAHGHYGPGGGFAGGVVLAVGVVLARLTLDRETSLRHFPEGVALLAMSAGMAIFLVAGIVPLLAGGDLLDYSQYPGTSISDSRLRYLGIGAVEIGVGAVVFGGILHIFDRLAHAGDD
ncbi:MAG TPA: MnhB domain-containing protein [Acidimicrobiales bacterium]|nr:MnhB domain-containing protein [Acidimicrobiales bacterium]